MLQCLLAFIIAVETSAIHVNGKPVFVFLCKFIFTSLFHKHASWVGSVFNHCSRYSGSLHSGDSWPLILGSYCILKLNKISSLSLIYFLYEPQIFLFVSLWFSVLIALLTYC